MKLPRMNSLLANDHAELDTLAEELVASLDGGDAQCIYRNLDYFWARLAMHIRAEHLHLFPALLRACRMPPAEAESAVSPKILESRIERLKDDHDFFMRELAAAVKQARGLSALGGTATAANLGGLREKLSGVLARLEIHNELEESEVYHLTGELFDPAARTELETRIRKELENSPPRFRRSNVENS